MRQIVTLTAAAALALAVGFGGTAKAQITLPFDDDLIVYYSFDDQTDKTTDDSGNGHDGTLGTAVGADTADPSFETADADKAPLTPNAAALDFDGTDDHVDVPNGATVKTLSQVTVSVWFNVDTLPGRFQYIYHESTPSSSASARLLLRIDNTDNMLHFGGRTNEANAFTVWVDSTTALSTGTWTHVAAVFNADTDVHKLYIDGVVQTNSLAQDPFLNVDPADIKIANYGGAVNVEFDGLLDDVRVYDRELTAQEIAVLANPALWISDPLTDAPEEIDISEVHVSHDGDLLTCEIDIATDDGLLNKSTFRCHIDFDDAESELAIGCDATGAIGTGDDSPFRLGENNDNGNFCTTSDITLTYRTGRRGGSCTGLPSITCEEAEWNAAGDSHDDDCNGDQGADATCTITLTGSLADIADVRDVECTDPGECKTDKDLDTGDYDVFMWFDSQHRGDRDRVPDTDLETTKPDETDEAVMFTLNDPTLP